MSNQQTQCEKGVWNTPTIIVLTRGPSHELLLWVTCKTAAGGKEEAVAFYKYCSRQRTSRCDDSCSGFKTT